MCRTDWHGLITACDACCTEMFGLTRGTKALGRRLVRIKRPQLEVLFITGYAENAVVENGHLEPGMEVLTKSFTMTALASKGSQMLGTESKRDWLKRLKLASRRAERLR